MKREKDRKAEVMREKKKAYAIRIARSQVKKALNRRGVTARREEKERKREVEDLRQKGSFIPIKLLDCIPDPEKLATDEDIDLQVREILISKPGFSGWDQDDEHIDNEENIDKFIGQQDEISLNCTWGRDSNLEVEDILYTI
jgi:hypothetical protein